MKRPIELFDAYLNKELSSEELIIFEERIKQDEAFKTAFEEHQHLIDTLKKADRKSGLKKLLKSIHQKEIGEATKIISLNEETFARKHGKTIAVAASTALFAVFSTVAVLSTGGYLLKKQSNQITELKRDVMKLQASNNGIVEGIIVGNAKANYAPANIEGSAFAINNDGFIITSYHLIKGADSIFIQNTNTERVLATLAFSDPNLDMAILKVNNDSITKNWQVPFVLNNKKTDIGEKVFTLGYPRKEMVYGEGSLSSLSGLNNDTSMFQISIPVNPGNSGGPLLDEQGNVIGVIRGKMAGAEATGFAIKANEILQAISIQSERSDLKVKILNNRSKLKNAKRTEQIKKINPYVFNVMVYKGE